MTQPSSSFHGLGIAPKLLEILDRNHFTTPTPIQRQAIPIAIEGKDVMGVAQTGTGKTLAFGIPAIQNLARGGGQALVLLPTRELALQVDEHLAMFRKVLGLRTAVILGGASMEPQRTALQRNPHIIVATPGRLIDHLDRSKHLLARVRILILDEADRMLDMGFAPQINRILSAVPKERQTMLFSATMPTEIVDIAKRHMRIPTRVEIARPGTTAEHIDQEVIFVGKQGKNAMLERTLGKYQGSVLVFTRTKWGAKKLTRDLKRAGHTAAEIHSNKTLNQRRAALEGFKTGQYRVLVATDIAARGIDVKNIELVVNYDLPSTPDDYVHRIGRTARAGRKGRAITFAMPDQRRDVRDIERLIRTQIPVSGESVQQLGVERPAPQPHHQGSGRRSGRPHRRRFQSHRRTYR